MKKMKGSLIQSGHQSIVRGILNDKSVRVFSYGSRFYNENQFPILYWMDQFYSYVETENPSHFSYQDVENIWRRVNIPPDKNRIVIASTPQWVDRKVLNYLDGGILHEAFHSLYTLRGTSLNLSRIQGILDRHYDPKVAYAAKRSIFKSLINIFEDAFIERLGIQEFAGAKRKLQEVHNLVWEMESEGRRSQNLTSGFNLVSHVTCLLRDSLKPHLEMHHLDEYHEDAHKILKVLLADVVKKSYEIKDSYDCLEIAFETFNLLFKPSENETEDSESEEDTSSQESEDTEDSEENSEPEKENQSSDEEPSVDGSKETSQKDTESEDDLDSEKEEEPSETEEKESEADEDSSEEDEDSQDETSEDKEDEGEDKDTGDSVEDGSDNDDDDDGEGESSESVQDLKDKLEKSVQDETDGSDLDEEEIREIIQSFHDILDSLDQIEGMVDIAQSIQSVWDDRVLNNIQGLLPFTTEYDTITEISTLDTPEEISEYNRMSELVREDTLYIRPKILNFFKGETKSRMIHNQKKGRRLSNRSISQVVYKEKPKPFMSKEITKRKSSCVSILMDESGSMVHRKTIAKEILMTLAHTIGACQIPFEVVGFTTHNDLYRNFHNDTGKNIEDDDLDRYTRIDSMRYRVFRKFDEQFHANSYKKLLQVSSLGTTPLADAIEFSYLRIKQRPEDQKIVFVITDGEPAVRGKYTQSEWLEYIKTQVQDYGKEGVEVLFIGIGDASYVNRYPNSVFIPDRNSFAKEMSHFIFDQMKRLL